ncbi:MAG: VWA domain-containing protein [Synergistaceae bacterium]|nr:VWA domain-containing protein [Synergistaceae bacterium]
MKQGLTEVVFILDRSGSMSGLESDTIGGFNSMLEKQRKEDGEAYISTVLFDHVSEVLHDRVPIEKIEPMTEKQYYVRGNTALLDAIGGAIRHIANIHKYARDEDRPEKTLFVIITDGKENASCNYSYARVKEMIENEKNDYGWEFLFLGANMDAVGEAKMFGIDSRRAVRYHSDRSGTRTNYRVLSKAVSSMRKARSREETDEILAEACLEIAEDYNKRP